MALYKIKPCRNCGEDYVGHFASKFCSARCKEAWHAKQQITRTCPHCGLVFTTVRKDQKFCCYDHKKAYEHARYLERRSVEEKTCANPECRKVFTSTQKRRYCSKECARKMKTH